MAAQEPKIGDCVQLKSGGPKMVVTHLGSVPGDPRKLCHCLWFSNDKPVGQDIVIEALVIVEDEVKGK